jgi:lambda repressor-like predicted transcriptional regulator
MAHTLTVAQLVAKLPAGVSLARLATLAGLHPDHLRQIIRGKRKARPITIAQLKIALLRLRARATSGTNSDFALYRRLLVTAAKTLNLDPPAVLKADPAAKGRTPFARQAAQARWLAFYLMNVSDGVAAFRVAQAAGVSKNAVSLALREVELKRETDPAFDALVSALEAETEGAM